MEKSDYRDNLAAVLDFTGGAQLLSISEVRRFTGLGDNRTVRRRFPISASGDISAATLARALCSEGGKR